jgi:hypothetical protein
MGLWFVGAEQACHTLAGQAKLLTARRIARAIDQIEAVDHRHARRGKPRQDIGVNADPPVGLARPDNRLLDGFAGRQGRSSGAQFGAKPNTLSLYH